MFRRFFTLGLGSFAAIAFAADSPTQIYPPAPTSEQVDDYNGVKVADPYRPLENPDAPESRKWIEAENQITFDFLKTIPEREGIQKRLTEVWDYERFGVPFKYESGGLAVSSPFSGDTLEGWELRITERDPDVEQVTVVGGAAELRTMVGPVVGSPAAPAPGPGGNP